MGRHKFQITVNTSGKRRQAYRHKMALFEISPFHLNYQHPAARRTCGRGMWGSNCRAGFWPSMWNGYPGMMELAVPVASDLFSRSENANFFNGKLKQEVTEDSIKLSLPLDGFDMKDLEVKVEDGTLKVAAKKEEKNDKGETMTTRMMKQTIALPEDCVTEDMETAFKQDGMLAISVPRKAKAIEDVNKQETSEGKEEVVLTAEETTSDMILATIPVHGYSPEELSVKVTGNGKAIEVSGRHEEKSADGQGRSVSQFSRTFPLPEDIEADKIQSHMAEENGGELTITAPAVMKSAMEAEAVKNIPVQMEVEKSD